MKRSERLYALVDHLRARSPRPIPGRTLADTFEVTVRTIERDILALQQSGVPIYAEPGRTGGYVIDREFSLPPLQFSATEATAIIAGLSLLAGSPFGGETQAAIDKIISALPERRHRKATELLSRTYLIGAGRDLLTRDRVLPRAIVDGAVLWISYSDANGAISERSVEPLGLLHGGDQWYLIGWCRARGGVRGFRTDRIRSVDVTDEHAPQRPEAVIAADLERWAAHNLADDR
ncbi:helix-turn-helix transcriptional regulator [Microlunatus soli]|uniref:HTH domain-containing protein n=1 Tax=Microlunatus soli TaxID=630515 RepID=A0A1H1YKV8_9ACTN|nr:YafY family protein [Microlunatus soli]SDT21965.1 HTH domain-containing protein [Microlunatus soli]